MRGGRLEVWRLGHVAAPLEPPPHHLASWAGRFDDPDRRFRTLYVARRDVTAIREVFAARRPAAEMVAVFGAESSEVRDARRVSLREEDRSRRLAAATLVHDGGLANLCTVPGRAKVATTCVDVLVAHGVQHLDETDVTSRDRAFTQDLAAHLYDAGHAGVRYTSNIDRGQCLAVFEGRYSLERDGRSAGARPSDVDEVMRTALGPLGLVVEG